MTDITQAARDLRDALESRDRTAVPLANIVVWGARPPAGREYISVHLHVDADAAKRLGDALGTPQQ